MSHASSGIPSSRHRGPAPSKVIQAIGRLWLKVTGWQIEGQVPPELDRAVFIAAPHTTNWDLPHMLGGSWAMQVKMSWLGKESLFKAPGGFALKWMGGKPVDRSAPHGLVGEAARMLREAEGGLWLAVPPSGTRGFRDHWKSGFYHIAMEAKVPILCGYLDYERKRVGVLDWFEPTGDVTADMDRIRRAYAPIEGKFGENKSTIRLRDEPKP